ncbi:hypothetical protein BJY52DRAFT_1372334 [Lactarius psammicola]|nr:hypothetical protein BJY52DRAFT_1372334 [Lactarius psammicola]
MAPTPHPFPCPSHSFAPFARGGHGAPLHCAQGRHAYPPYACCPCAQSGGWGSASGLWRTPWFACPHGAYKGEERRAPVAKRPPVHALPLREPKGWGPSLGVWGRGHCFRPASRSHVALARELRRRGRGGAQACPGAHTWGRAHFRVPVASCLPAPHSCAPEHRWGWGTKGWRGGACLHAAPARRPGEGGTTPLLGLRARPAAHMSPEGRGHKGREGSPFPFSQSPPSRPPFSAPPDSVNVANGGRGGCAAVGEGGSRGGRKQHAGKRVPPTACGQQGTWKGGGTGKGGRGHKGGGWGRGHKRRLREGWQGGGRGKDAPMGGGAHKAGMGDNEGAWDANAVCSPTFASPACTQRGGGTAWKWRGWKWEGAGTGAREVFTL